MNQSSLITGAVLVAFLFFLAARGRLGVYAAALFGTQASGSVGGATGTPAAATGSPPPVAAATSTPQSVSSPVVSTSPASSGSALPNAAATPAGASALTKAMQSIGFGAAQQDQSHLLDLATQLGTDIAF